MDIIIIGGGFAAITAVQSLRKKAPNANIKLIAPQAEFIYYPSLIWLPSGLRKESDLKVDLQNFFSKHQVEFVAASVSEIKAKGRIVVADGKEHANNGLIIASGATFIKDLPGLEHTFMPCLGIEATQQISARLASLESGTIAFGMQDNPKEKAASRGAGPIFEFLFGIDTLLRRQNKRDKFNLVFFSHSDNPAAAFGESANQKFLARMEQQNIKTHFGEPITGFAANLIEFSDSKIDADLIIMQTGLTGAKWLDNSDLPRSPGNLIQADEHAQVVGFEACYVAGDAGSYPGGDWQLKLGYAGELQAKAAAENLVCELNGNPQDKKPYKKELLYAVDSLSHGTFIKRSESQIKALPPLRLFHYLKRILEWLYLRRIS